jgi:hypothetical protein
MLSRSEGEKGIALFFLNDSGILSIPPGLIEGKGAGKELGEREL